MAKKIQDLELIDLDIPQLGYFKFISSWLYTGSDGNFLVDPGPACTIGRLKNELKKRSIDQLDWILLTHIHQDHAGGLGDLIKEYPTAKVVVHEKGVKHLIDPTKLWKGSKNILGEVALVYDRILPVPKNNILVTNEIPFSSGIKVISTPGHASHHQCFIFSNMFFAGELYGAHIPTEQGFYLRPATPHRFVLEDYLESMKKVKSDLVKNICFAHYGINNEAKQVLSSSSKQLKLWIKIIEENHMSSHDVIFEELLNNDENLNGYQNFNQDMQAREKHFSINSIIGIQKYLDSKQV